MPHGNRDQLSDAPTWVVDASSGESGQAKYGNTMFGVSAVEAQVTNGPASPGWVIAQQGQGQLTGMTIFTAGTLYANTDTFNVVATSGANATGTITTNANGSITAVALTATGGLFKAAPTVTITTSAGTTGVLRPVLSGRAGRISFETIVATRHIVTDSTSFANGSSANVANSSGTVDNFIFPNS